jgi:hypothetical protein
MKEKSCDCDFLHDLKKYYKHQEEICYNSKLYEDINEHGSKVIMLFAEIFSFMVEKYGIHHIPSIISEYQNSAIFQKWFWNIKHKLGQEVLRDPSFCDIGKWIGKGMFLKICLSLIYHNHLLIDEKLISQIVDRQKHLLVDLIKDNFFRKNGKKAIEIINSGYFLLKEKIILSYENNNFYKENIIK